MEINIDIAREIYDKTLKAEKILIMSHRNPDADTIGSNLALRLFLEAQGKNVTSACVDPVEPGCDFLPNAETFINEFNPANFDLFMSVDAGSTAQAAFPEKYPELLGKTAEGKTAESKTVEGRPAACKTEFINIDHHPSNGGFGTVNLVIDSAASTTLIIFNLFKLWRAPVNKDMATCLLYGLYYDTGSFMHSNTSEEVYEAAAELLKLGASKDLIVKNLFRRGSIERLQLLGKILSEIQVTKNNVVISAVKNEDLATCKASPNDLSGAIDYLSMVKANSFATLLSEDGKGNIKGSLRTRRDDLNMTEIAGNFGGGGHKKASGFTIKGRLEKETRWSII